MNTKQADDQATDKSSETQPRKKRKPPVRSGYLFPIYDLGTALRISEKIEREGAGRLGEATLAISLGQSIKSSGFRLRLLSAKQFGLIAKEGDDLATTPTAKSIIKPMRPEERLQGLSTAFLNIPLFKEVANRFNGTPLPQGQAFRNVLEREFHIEASRVQDAERKILDSAREADVLIVKGDKQYLTPGQQTHQDSPPLQGLDNSPNGGHGGHTQFTPPYHQPPQHDSTTTKSEVDGLFTVTAEDLAALEEAEFQEIWGAIGKLVRARGKRNQLGLDADDQKDEGNLAED